MELIWLAKRFDNKGVMGRSNELFYSLDVALEYFAKRGYELYIKYPGVIHLSKGLHEDALPTRLSFIFDYSLADSWVMLTEVFVITKAY